MRYRLIKSDNKVLQFTVIIYKDNKKDLKQICEELIKKIPEQKENMKNVLLKIITSY